MHIFLTVLLLGEISFFGGPCTIKLYPCPIKLHPCIIKLLPCTIKLHPCTLKLHPCTIKLLNSSLTGTEITCNVVLACRVEEDHKAPIYCISFNEDPNHADIFASVGHTKVGEK